MDKLEIGLYDVFSQAVMAESSTAADVFDDHIRIAQEAEQLGCQERNPPSRCRNFRHRRTEEHCHIGNSESIGHSQLPIRQ